MTEGQRKYQFMLKMASWQRRKSEIMNRDNFSCQDCGRSGTTVIHVHHKIYIWNRMPWEYEDEDLISLCPVCHHKRHIKQAELVGPIIDRRPETVKAIDVQIDDLKVQLTKDPPHERIEEILKIIMFLRTERKGLIKY